MLKAKILASLFFVLLLSVEIPLASSSSTIESGFALAPPTIDGVVHKDEWGYAVIAGKWSTGIIMVQNDLEYIYILLDVSGDAFDDPPSEANQTIGDSFLLAFDVNLDMEATGKLDIMYGLYPYTRKFTFWYLAGPEGIIEEPQRTVSLLGNGFGASVYTSNPHRVWEFAINLKEIKAEPRSLVRIGLWVTSQNPKFVDIYPPDWINFEKGTIDFTKLIDITLAKTPPTPTPRPTPSPTPTAPPAPTSTPTPTATFTPTPSPISTPTPTPSSTPLPTFAIPMEFIAASIGGIAIISAVLIYLKKKPREKAPRPSALRITAEPTEIQADERSTSTITIELLDDEGKLVQASEDTEVKLSTSLGRITSPVTIHKGDMAGKATLTSSTEYGAVRVSAESRGLKGASTGLRFLEKKRYCMHCGARMPLDAEACPECGRMPPSGVDVKVCKNCSEVIPIVARFCGACGASQPT